MSSNPYESRDVTGESPAPKKKTRAGRVFKVLAVVGVVGIVIALFLPAVRFTGPAAYRMQCSNNLKQIGLALHNYEEAYHAFPPAYTVDAAGKPLHSWRTLILPYLEQQLLYDKIDLSKPWDDPANQVAYDTHLPAYRCPSVDLPPGRTTYLAILAPGGCFQPTEPRQRSAVTDDPDRTLMVVEVNSERAVHWMSPTDVGEQWIENIGAHATLPHPKVVPALCVSGSVVYLPTDTKVAAIRALISIAGNDDSAAQEAN